MSDRIQFWTAVMDHHCMCSMATDYLSEFQSQADHQDIP